MPHRGVVVGRWKPGRAMRSASATQLNRRHEGGSQACVVEFAGRVSDASIATDSSIPHGRADVKVWRDCGCRLCVRPDMLVENFGPAHQARRNGGATASDGQRRFSFVRGHCLPGRSSAEWRADADSRPVKQWHDHKLQSASPTFEKHTRCRFSNRGVGSPPGVMRWRGQCWDRSDCGINGRLPEFGPFKNRKTHTIE